MVNTYKRRSIHTKKPRIPINYNGLLLQAFDNAAQANIISTVASGKIIIANNAACKLLGYSGKELLAKSTPYIFNTNNKSLLKKPGSTLYCSDEVLTIWGVSPGTSEANYKEFYNNIHPDDREIFDASQVPVFCLTYNYSPVIVRSKFFFYY